VNDIKIQVGTLADLNQWIPAWLNGLSLARSQIVIDQIRGFLERSQRCVDFRLTGQQALPIESPLLFLISTDSNRRRCAVLAGQSFSVSHDQPSGHLGDCATILHAGAMFESFAGPSQPPQESPNQIPDSLVCALEDTLANRGVRFLQWAIDADPKTGDLLAETCQTLGMQKLATLDYLSAATDQIKLDGHARNDLDAETEELTTQSTMRQAKMKLRPVDWGNADGDDVHRFQSLVDKTYQDTKDCPALSHFRNASQTLQAYKNVDSYDPSRWYFVLHPGDETVPIGCVIMASHGESEAVPTSELVYMALVPEKRGQGLGRSLVKLALSEPQLRFASKWANVSRSPQIVLAVDQQNTAARQLYLDVGLRPLLCESVWGRSIGDTLSTTT
jgi:GNAT superfamily N-acetyltransferase